jgi:hypothetical protein
MSIGILCDSSAWQRKEPWQHASSSTGSHGDAPAAGGEQQEVRSDNDHTGIHDASSAHNIGSSAYLNTWNPASYGVVEPSAVVLFSWHAATALLLQVMRIAEVVQSQRSGSSEDGLRRSVDSHVRLTGCRRMRM